jgi:hypothetical protein
MFSQSSVARIVNYSGHTSVIHEMSDRGPWLSVLGTAESWILVKSSFFSYRSVCTGVSLSDGKFALLCCDIDWPVLDRLKGHPDTSLHSSYENSTLPRTAPKISGRRRIL